MKTPPVPQLSSMTKMQMHPEAVPSGYLKWMQSPASSSTLWTQWWRFYLWGREAIQKEASFWWAGTPQSKEHGWRVTHKNGTNERGGAQTKCWDHSQPQPAFQSVPSCITEKQPQFPVSTAVVLRTPDALTVIRYLKRGNAGYFSSPPTPDHKQPKSTPALCNHPHTKGHLKELCMTVMKQNKMKASRSASVSNTVTVCWCCLCTGRCRKTSEHLPRVFWY